MANNYEYGFSEAFLASNREVRALVNKAAAGNWTPERFESALKDTAWFKRYSDTARARQVEAKTDPATYNRKVAEWAEIAQETANQLGVTGIDVKALAQRAMDWGWDEEELREAIAGALDWNTATPGAAEDMVWNLVDQGRSYGVSIGEAEAQNWTKGILTGKESVERVDGLIRERAAATYTQWADQIRAGQTVEELAAPWLAAYQNTLEVAPADIDLTKDATLRKALIGYTNEDGTKGAMNLAEFETSLRKDNRWQHTANGRDILGGIAQTVLKDFGMV